MPSRNAPRVRPIPCPFGTGGTVYAYYIEAPEPALIDTGVAASPAGCIEPALAAAGVRLEDVRWILATHGHWDHIGGMAAARDLAPNAQTAIHAADAPLLADRSRHLEAYAGGARFRFIDDSAALAAADALLLENISGQLGADRELSDGERVDLGGGVSLRVVHTPGHSPGSATYLLDGHGWAFVGDAAQGWGSVSGRFPLFVQPEDYSASLRRLLDYSPRRLLLGHRFLGRDGATLPAQVQGAAVGELLRLSLEVEGQVAAAVASSAPGRDGAWDLSALGEVARAIDPEPGASSGTWPTHFFTTISSYPRRPAR